MRKAKDTLRYLDDTLGRLVEQLPSKTDQTFVECLTGLRGEIVSSRKGRGDTPIQDLKMLVTELVKDSPLSHKAQMNLLEYLERQDLDLDPRLRSKRSGHPDTFWDTPPEGYVRVHRGGLPK